MRSFPKGAHGVIRSLTIVGASLAAAVVLPAAASGASLFSRNAPPPPHPSSHNDIWAATWEASPEQARPPLVTLSNQTVRQVARISLGGEFVRVQLSNEFGDKPLVIGAAHIAMAQGAGSAEQPGTDMPLTFGGRSRITIPVGARVLSDPVRLHAPAMADVAVSLYFPQDTGAVTEDYFAIQTSYMVPGDMTAAPSLPGAATITKRVILTGIEVSGARGTKVVVALGDSLTRGYGSTPDTNNRWPDRLAQRLVAQREDPPIGVVNAGIGGNRLLHDFFGPNALARFDRDVLSQPSVGYLIVELGINDFGLPGGRNLPDEEVSADDVIAGYRQLIERAHSYGIKVFMGTIPPFGGFNERPGFYSDAAEAKRQAVNQWIRLNKDDKGAPIFEGVVDFEAAVRDPRAPSRLAPQFDSGDHLDPNDAGYAAMGDAVEMRLFQ